MHSIIAGSRSWRALNHGVLPGEYFALPEQNIRGPNPDVLTLKLAAGHEGASESNGGIAVATLPPRTRLTKRAEAGSSIRKASRITVRDRHGTVVAVVEIISPGNKASQAEFRALVEKSVALIRQGIHLLVIDPFPPSKRDPQGIHKAIWDEFEEDELEMPADKRLTVASYDAGPDYVAYVEFIGIGDQLPQRMPLFLQPGVYVPVPLDDTYQAAWNEFPQPLKGLLDSSNGS